MMSTDFLDNDLEEQVQAHFKTRYGEAPPPDSVWNNIETRLGAQDASVSAMPTNLDGTGKAAITGKADEWMPLPYANVPTRALPRRTQGGIFRSLALAASVVLALGVMMAGAFGLSYIFTTQTANPDPAQQITTPRPSPQPTAVSTPSTLAQQSTLLMSIAAGDWLVHGDNSYDFQGGVDSSVLYEGEATGYIKSASPGVTVTGMLVNSLTTDQYPNKRIRFSAYLKSENVIDEAGLWLEVAAGQPRVLSFDGVNNRPIKGTTGWQFYSITVDMPRNSYNLNFGVMLHGEGHIWIADAKLEEVGPEVAAIVPTVLADAGFEDGTDQYWVALGTQGSPAEPIRLGPDHAGVDNKIAHSGQASYYLKSDSATAESSALLAQYSTGALHAGKRVRLSAYLKTDNVTRGAAIWINASELTTRGNLNLANDNLMNYAPVKGTTGWTQYSLVIDVPSRTTSFGFGAYLGGGGTLWVDDFKLEEVGSDVPTTGTSLIEAPSNLNFEQGLAEWGLTGWSPLAYSYEADTSTAYDGKTSAHVASRVPFDPTAKRAQLEQYLDGEQFSGKRVRFTGYLKTQDISGVAGLFLRSYDVTWQQAEVNLSKLEGKQAKGTTEWTRYEIVMDIPENVFALGYGLSIVGEGEVWMDALTVEVVGSDVPVTALPEPPTP